MPSVEQILSEVKRKNDERAAQLSAARPDPMQIHRDAQTGARLTPVPLGTLGSNLPSTSAGGGEGFLGRLFGGNSGQAPEQYLENVELARLQNSVAGQRNEAKFLTGEDPIENENEGFVSKLFDVLSRANYGVAEGTRRALDEDGNYSFGDIIGGVGSGLAGRSKTTFEDVLEQEGMEKGWKRSLLGVGSDILFDPSTYIGAGLIKGAGKGVLKTTGGRSAVDAISEAVERGGKASYKVQTRAARKVEKDLLEHARVAGKPANADDIRLAKEAARKLTRDEFQSKAMHQALKKADEAEQLRAADEAARIQIRFMGKPIGESELAYKAAQMPLKMLKPITQTEVMQRVNKFFRPVATFPELTNSIKRTFESQGVAHWEHQAKNIKSMLDDKMKLSADDKKLISQAIENGDALSGTRLEEPTKWIRDTFDELFDAEVAAGILKADDYVENYVPHYLQAGASKQSRKGAKKKSFVGGEEKGFQKERSIESLNKAKDLGLDPVTDIHQILLYRLKEHHQLLARKSAIDEITREYGVKVGGKGKNMKIKTLREKGLVPLKSKFSDGTTYVPDNIAKAINTLEDAFESDEITKGLMQYFDKGTHAWKTMATVVNPGHHIRNSIGDMYLNWLDGVIDPRVYDQAAGVLAHVQGEGGVFKKGFNAAARGNRDKIKIGNSVFHPNDIWAAFRESGAKSGFYNVEFGADVGTQMGAKVMRPIREFTETREDWIRMAHFIDVLKKEGKKQAKSGKKVDHAFLKTAADQAAGRVRKWNIDYGDLTEGEKKLKKAIPFYTFMRKNLPLQLEALALRPGKAAILPKAQNAIESLLGVSLEPDVDGYGQATAIPKWLRDMSATRIMGGDQPVFLAFPTPFHEAMERIGDVYDTITDPGEHSIQRLAQSGSSMLNPFIRTPVEVAVGRQTFTGAPTDAKSAGMNVVPPLRTASQLVGAVKEGDGAERNRVLLNYLTGLGVQRAGVPQQKGELRRQEDIVQGLLRAAREKTSSAAGFQP